MPKITKRRVKGIEHKHNEFHAVYTDNIAPGIKLTCVKTDKFKTGSISVTLVTGLDPSTAAGTALLPRVLRRGSSGYPDLQSISAALDDLYGARIEPSVRKKGELHCISLYADFPDSRYIPGSGDVLAKTVSMLCGMLLSPALDGGEFRADYVSGEVKNLIDDIRAAVNDKRGYSVSRLIEEMCAGEAYAVHRLGSEEDAANITAGWLADHHKTLLSTAHIEIFYCGCEGHELLRKLFRDALQGLPARTCSSMPKTGIKLYPPEGSPRFHTETMDVIQGKLVIGFRLGRAMKGRPDLPALIVFNAIYGAGETSKLFMNVREKLSLCYYAGSMMDKNKGVMIVSSGIEPSDYERALGEILAQLEQVKGGAIFDWELTAAKRSVITSIKQSLDRPGGLADIYFDESVSEYPYDPYDLCKEIETVNLDRIMEAASEISADSIYFLNPGEVGAVRQGDGSSVLRQGDGSSVLHPL